MHGPFPPVPGPASNIVLPTILASERVLCAGRVFSGLNCEGDACRWLIGLGFDPATPVRFYWHDGRSSTRGTLGAYAARWYEADGAVVRRWRPSRFGAIPPVLAAWHSSRRVSPRRRNPEC